jgi:hypothetical protein
VSNAKVREKRSAQVVQDLEKIIVMIVVVEAEKNVLGVMDMAKRIAVIVMVMVRT